MTTKKQKMNDNTENESIDRHTSKTIIPFNLSIDPMERLIVVSFKGDPEFEMLEPQVFDDKINGKGMRVLRYRKDKKVDIYFQPGVFVDESNFTIGAGIGDLQETRFDESTYDIDEHGVNVNVAFTDAQGRKVKLVIRENSTETKRLSFLAPVGKDIENPTQLFLAYMLDFDFVRKKGTTVHIEIGERILKPDSFPILRNYKKNYFIRYSANPVVGVINKSMNKPVVLDSASSKTVRVENMAVEFNSQCKVIKLSAAHKEFNVDMNFPGGLPNLIDLDDNSQVSNVWEIVIAGDKITGGIYTLNRKGNIMDVELEIVDEWTPVNLTAGLKIFTKLIRSFRTWPSTYRYIGKVYMDEKISQHGRWERC